MNYSVGLYLAACGLLVVSCSSNAPYKDQAGRSSETIPTYNYAASAPVGTAASSSAVPGVITPPGVVGAPWPRSFVVSNTTNTVYQPQVDSWDGTTLTARSAVAVQKAGQAQPLYGLVNIQATTLVDKTARTVTLIEVRLISADFPSVPAQNNDLLQALREQFPKRLSDLSLDSLESSLAANQEQLKANAQPLDNSPPKIIFSTAPAVLVAIDGPPAYRPVQGTELHRVLNTSVLLLKDSQPRPMFYLRGPAGYLQAPRLEGPWAPGAAPSGAQLAEKEAAQAGQTDFARGLLDTAPPGDASGGAPIPEIYVTTVPTELVSFNGQPDFAPIPGTKLLYAANTTGNVFKLLTDQQNYILIAGRWYRAPGLGGPWNFVPGHELPADFKQIPDSSPKENVKASVPGTPQAREALIANSIPQTTGISRDSQMQDPVIDGAPQLAAIQGTPLQYVVNSGTPIIRVDEKSWYACQNGVWYVATSVNGPWTVAASVPAVIYSIPPSSPMHYVTYVKVYDSTPEVVYAGYTPGYLGTVVSSDYVVVYGTGYYYQPWIGTVWYPPPVTWGLGCAPFWSPWSGWSFGFGFGWYAGYYPYAWYPYPYWGPYRYWHHHDWHPYYGPIGHPYTAVNVYQRVPARTRPVSAQPARSQPLVPLYGRSYNSRTGTLSAGERAGVQNVFRNSGRPAPGQNRVAPIETFPTSDGRVFVRDSRSRPTSSRATSTHSTGRQYVVPSGETSRERPSRSDGESRERPSRDSSYEAPDFSPPPSSPPPSRGFDGGERGRGSPPAAGGRGGRGR